MTQRELTVTMRRFFQEPVTVAAGGATVFDVRGVAGLKVILDAGGSATYQPWTALEGGAAIPGAPAVAVGADVILAEWPFYRIVAAVKPAVVCGVSYSLVKHVALDAGGSVSATLLASEAHIGEVGVKGYPISDDFTLVGGATAYVPNDRLAVDANTSAVTPLRRLVTARKQGGSGFITGLSLQINQLTALIQVRVHLYRVAQPTTAIPADNAAYPVKWANRLVRIGHIDLPVTAAFPDAGSDMVGASDYKLRFPFVCDPADDGVYYALQTLTGVTLAAGVGAYLKGTADLD